MTQDCFTTEEGFQILTLDGDKSKILRGTVDPSIPAGVSAPVSSIFMRDVGGAGTDAEIYQKFGPADIDWKLIGSGTAGVIGAAEDADYTDGLFIDFDVDTPTGTAIDRFNEILKALSPPPAPLLDNLSCADSGASGKLSFGPTNPIATYFNVDGAGGSTRGLNDSWTVSGSARGLFNGSIIINGTLNDDVPAHAYAYPANSFGDADQGEIQIEVNGVVVHTVDLTAFGSGTDSNANGSGFNLSAATPVEFEDTTQLDQFQYRVGTWIAGVADQRNGYNYIRINHFYGASDHWTNYYEWVNDPEATAMTADSQLLDSLVMTGSKFLSGVEYHTAGSAQYDVIIHDCHRNVYSSSGSAVSFNVTNGSASSQALGNIVDQGVTEVVTDKTVTVTNSGRLLDAVLTVGISCLHPLKSNLTNAAQASIPGLLLDGVNTSNTAINENFCLEDWRMQAIANGAVNNYDDQADLSLGYWDDTEELETGTVGHTDGLLVYNGALRYPTQGLDSGDFRNVADGNANGPENGHSGNPNYSALSGARTFYREFTNNSGLTKANFKFVISGTGGFTDIVTGPNGQALTVELKFPDGSITTGTGWLDFYADFATDQWADGDGCRSAGYGSGRTMGIDWGGTVGTKSIAAGESIVMRITAPSIWTGNINDIVLTWL
ncbi:MAG: hypothetical protein KAJ73_00380 [Zetaproteobacteria bacterium]|nr:hypothetical protein [Zetaproteobacteria bacterium]